MSSYKIRPSQSVILYILAIATLNLHSAHGQVSHVLYDDLSHPVTDSSFISDGVSHVTSIKITQYGTNNIYSFLVNGLGSETPDRCTGSLTSLLTTFTFTAAQRITKVEIWLQGSLTVLTKVVFTLNDLSTKEISLGYLPSDTSYSYSTPTGSEFVGFKGYGRSGSNLCGVHMLQAIYRYDCTLNAGITIDLSTITRSA